MRLVDCKERQLRTRQQTQRARLQQTLWRYVEHIQLAIHQRCLGALQLVKLERGVQTTRLDAQQRQRIHLILHQRDQRRNNYAGSFSHNRGQLIAERFTPTGRHHNQRITVC